MGQILHGNARTTEAVRRAIQHSQESLRALSKCYGIDQKTVAKWQKRTSIADLPTGLKEPKSTVLLLAAWTHGKAAHLSLLCCLLDSPTKYLELNTRVVQALADWEQKYGLNLYYLSAHASFCGDRR